MCRSSLLWLVKTPFTLNLLCRDIQGVDGRIMAVGLEKNGLASGRKKYACQTKCVLQQWSRRVVAATLAEFVLGGLSFRGENPESDFWWRLSSRFLVEGIVWSWTSARLKTHNLTMLVIRTTTVFVHCYLPEGVVLETFRCLVSPSLLVLVDASLRLL